MDLEIRPATADERVPFVRAVEAAFGHHPTEEELVDDGWEFEPERNLIVLDAGRIVATTGAYSLELTLPGSPGQACPLVPAAGVTAVGVHPTHRRRGILRELMARQLDDVAARGEALAILTASEGGIYGRFGYGKATLYNSLEVDKARSAFAVTVDDKGGRVRLVDADEAGKLLPPLFDAARQAWPGQVARTPGYWKWMFRDVESHRDGASARWYVVHETDGRLDGYSMYRFKHSWVAGIPGSEVLVREVQATAPNVRLALWRYLLDIDLASTLKAELVSVDEPLPWAMADPRRARVTVGQGDWLWARIVDVPAALSARGYSVDGRLVFDVADSFRPATGGRFELAVSGGTASCQPVEGTEPDLTLDIASLSAAYLGGVRFSTLAAAGRVHNASPSVLARADAMFASTPFPWCASGF
jgi:predicted acetyltransferase